MSKNTNVDDDAFSDENFDENTSVASAKLETLEETPENKKEPASSELLTKKKIGFTGADKLNDDDQWLKLEQLLRSANLEGKSRQAAFENLRDNFAHRKRNAKKSLFEDDFTPQVQSTRPAVNFEAQPLRSANALFSPGFVQGFPWANDLAKVRIPKLYSISEEDILCFQLEYKKYLQKVNELSERYGSRIPIRTVYNCIDDETLYYLCYMTKLIPEEHRTTPAKLSRSIVHDTIMKYTPPGSSVYHRNIELELQQIKIKLWPNGLKSIEQAWYQLIKMDKKYHTTIKSKVVIQILTKNLQPACASKQLWRMMITGSEEEQSIRGNLIKFHTKLIDIANSISVATRFLFADKKSIPNGKKEGKALLANPKPTGPSKAAIKEKGCKWHGPNCWHGTSECYIEHPEKHPNPNFDREAAIVALKNRQKAKEKKRLERTKELEKKIKTAAAYTLSNDNNENNEEVVTKTEDKDTSEKQVRFDDTVDVWSTDYFSAHLYQVSGSSSQPIGDHFDFMKNTTNDCIYHTKFSHSNKECHSHELNTVHRKSAKLNSTGKSTIQATKVGTEHNDVRKKSVNHFMKIPKAKKGKKSINIYQLLDQEGTSANSSKGWNENFSNALHYFVEHKECKFSFKRNNKRCFKWFEYAKKKIMASAFPTGAKLDDDSYIWDSGASHSVSSDAQSLTNIKAPPFKSINGLTGRESAVRSTGTVGNIRNILSVPSAKQNLLSVGAFLDQKGGSIIFTNNDVKYKPEHPRTRIPVLIGRRREDGLYTALSHTFEVQSPSINLSRAEVQFQILREKIHTLHRVLGHAGKPKMRNVLHHNRIGTLRPEHVDLMTYCHACKVGHAKFVPANKFSKSKATKFGERLVADLSGKVRTRSRSHCLYASVIVDEYSSWVWLRGLQTPKQTHQHVKDVISKNLHQRADRYVKFFRSDNGSEYVNESMNQLLNEFGIQRERTCAYSSYQNGKAERHIGILFAMMRKVMFESRLPPTFWVEALYWAVYTHNRLPLQRKDADGKSPFELRYQRKPDIRTLRPFGVRGSVTIPVKLRSGKIKSYGKECIMVGYGYITGQKGYRVFTPETGKITTSINAVFDSMISSLRSRKVAHPTLFLEEPYREIYSQYFQNKIEPRPLYFKVSSHTDATTERGNNSITDTSYIRSSSSAVRNSTIDDIEDGYLSVDDDPDYLSMTNIQHRDTNPHQRLSSSTLSHPTTPPMGPTKTQINQLQVDIDEKTPAFTLTEFEANSTEESNNLPPRIIQRMMSNTDENMHAVSTTTTEPSNDTPEDIESSDDKEEVTDNQENKTRKRPLPTGWIEVEDNEDFNNYLNRDANGRPIQPPDTTTGSTIAERTRNRKRGISNHHPAFMACVAHVSDAVRKLASNYKTPKHYGEAMQSKHRDKWIEAIQKELDAIKSMDCYELIDLKDVPKGANIIGNIWVFKVKKKGDGSLDRFKARTCVKGNEQKYGIDFVEVFSPVASQATIRMVFAIAVHFDMELWQFDIVLAFVTSKIDKPVYMTIPKGAKGRKDQVWKLKKSLYGLKQAPRLFNNHLNNILRKNGFKRSDFDPCLYVFKEGKVLMLLITVVDDLLLATNSNSHKEAFEKAMQKEFDLKSMGKPEYMIGMNVCRSKDKISISQSEYIREICNRFEIQHSKKIQSPASAEGQKSLCKIGYRDQQEIKLTNPKKYRSLVGSLMYAVLTRPDIAAPVSMAARYLHNPCEDHMHFAMRILQYLHSTIDVRLVYTKTENPKLIVYADSSWLQEDNSAGCRFGYLVFFGNALVSWKSKLHKGTCLSSAEAEYICATHATKEAKWLNFIASEISQNPDKILPIKILEDNTACIKMAKNPIVSGRNKHMGCKISYLREQVANKSIFLEHIRTDKQLADFLTKNLPSPKFKYLRDCILDPGSEKPCGLC